MSENLKSWFGASKVVDSRGEPLRVYHGTTSSFVTFNRSKTHIESNWGRGFYFTNQPEDAAGNYGHPDSPDRSHNTDLATDFFIDRKDMTVADAEKAARMQYGGDHLGGIMPCYLRIERPFINDKKRCEKWSADYEDLDYGFETMGPFARFIAIVTDVMNKFRHEPVDYGYLANKMTYDTDGVVGAYFVVKQIRNLLYREELYASGDRPNVSGDASCEILRIALKKMGYDGIIDYDVFDKFGDLPSIGAHMNPDTVHYIVFDRNQIKSATGNRGSYDRSNPSVTESLSRRILRILEGYDEDGTVRRKAVEVFESVWEHFLRFMSEPKQGRNSDGFAMNDQIFWRMSRADLEIPDSGMSYVSFNFGKFTRTLGEIKRVPNLPPEIVIGVKTEEPEKDYGSDRTKRVARNLFVHEYVHLLDYKRRPDGYKNRHVGGVATPQKYLSNPTEYNAWFQAGADAVLSNPEHRNHLSSFKAFLSYFVSESKWAINDMEEVWRRKAIRRIHSLYDSIRVGT